MTAPPDPSPLNRAWPLPALAAWALGWLVYRGLGPLDPGPGVALAAGACAPAALAWGVRGFWRRAIVGAGFPLSMLALGAGSDLPAWVWLAPLLLLLLVYPLQAWRDAPVFPTEARALEGLERIVPLADGARVLDAGSGLGHGLQALRARWPGATIEGLERSRPLSWIARWRCPWARVSCADMWQASWQGVDLVYLFQRPETMARAWAKARAEMAPGGWLASLEFEVPGVLPHAVLRHSGCRPLHVYRLGGEAPSVPAQSRRSRADKTQRTASATVPG